MVETGRTRYRRVDGVVHRWSEGEVLALGADGDLRVLSGAAATVYAALTDELGLAALERRVAIELGEPPPGVVQEGLSALIGAGLVDAAERS